MAGTEYKLLRHRCRSEAGFGNQGECIIIVLMMGMTLAVLTPEVLRRSSRRGETRSARCIGNLLEIADGADPAALACPITGDAYTLRKGESGERIACPDPDNHIGYAVYLVREGDGWVLRVDLPPPPPLDSAGQLVLGRQTVAVAPNEVRIETAPPSPLVRFVVGPLFILFVGAVFFMPLYGMLGAPGPDDMQAGVVFFVILCTGLVTVAVMAKNLARSEEMVLQGDTRRIRIQARHYGLELTTIETLESVRGVYPATFRGQVGAVAIYEDDGELSYRVLMESYVEDASVFSYFSSVFRRE